MTSYNTDGTVGPWAREKLELLRRYLEAYTTILRSKNFQDFYFVDAFAGAGSAPLRNLEDDKNGIEQFGLDIAAFRLGDDDEIAYVKGSPRVALEIKHPFTKYIFIEKDAGRSSELVQIANEHALSDRVEILNGDANTELTRRLLSGAVNWRRNRGIVFLDPFGLQVPWDTISRIAETKALEIIVNFPVGMAIQRLLPKHGQFSDDQRSKLTAYLGSPEWESLLYQEAPDLFGEVKRSKVDASGDKLAMWYRDKIKSAFGHATFPRLITNQQGSHLYYLIHAGPKDLGVKIASDVLFKGRPIIR
ncbi:MAG: three-Cys-motif partner protein TcmP [Amphiplicatus sp.]